MHYSLRASLFQIFRMNFYFLMDKLNDIQPTEVNDQHPCVVFAQGLQGLGVPYHGNMPFLKDFNKETFLIDISDEINSNTIVVTNQPQKYMNELQQYKRQGHKIIVMDTCDEWCRNVHERALPFTDYYYRSSYHTSNRLPNVFPFAFSLSNRIIQTTSFVDMKKWSERTPVIFQAHRVDHSLRNHVKNYYNSGRCPIAVEYYNDKFEAPKEGTEEHFHWCQTGRRHSVKYYEKLASVQMIDAHGGHFTPQKLLQIDSWKLWEGFAAGCLVITLDFKYYGIQLPFELIGYKHYIPIRYDKLDESYQMLNRLTTEQRARIASSGREYVLSNYSPEGIAKYICSKLNA